MTATLAAYLAIAAMAWGPAPCGTPQVQWAHAPDPATMAGWVAFDVYRPQDLATVDCTIYIDARDLWHPDWNCSLIVHEWGHLTGHKHSSDPLNVMHTPAAIYWRCRSRWRLPVQRAFRRPQLDPQDDIGPPVRLRQLELPQHG